MTTKDPRKPHVLKILRGFAGDGPNRLVLNLLRQWSPDRIAVSIVALAPEGTLRADIEEEVARLGGISQVFPTPVRHARKTAGRVAREIRRQRITHIHAHLLRADIVARRAARLTHTPCLVTEHGIHSWGEKGRVLRPGVRRWYLASLKGGVTVCAISEKVYRDLEGEGVPPRRLRLVRNGVNLDEFTATSLEERRTLRAKIGIDETAGPVLVAVGSLIPRKSPRTVLHVLKYLQNHGCPGARLIYLGDGPMATDLKREALSLGLGHQVHLIGYRQNPREIVAAADICVHPSKDEPFGLVVAEAMATGLPVVVRAGAGSDDLIAPMPLSFAAEGDDIPAWGAAVLAAHQYLKSDPEKIIQGCHSFAQENFDIRETARGYLRLYRSGNQDQRAERSPRR